MRLHSTCRQDGTPPGVAQEKIQSLSAAPQASQRGRPANTHLSLRWRGRLRTSLLGVGFVGFMMPNDTASGSTDFSMARHVTRHPPTIAPLMHPFAWAALESARLSRAVQMISLLMTVFSGVTCGSISAAKLCSDRSALPSGTLCFYSY